MVVKRQCSFCANEIEPGTGRMFVKRDGSVFNFCSSSCRKQQLHLGRVGHRRKWTRAHAMKRAAGHAATHPSEKVPAKPAGAPAPTSPPSPAPAKPRTEAKDATAPAAPATAETPEAGTKGEAAPPAAPGKEGAGKPRRRTPKPSKGGTETPPQAPPSA